jgi:HD-GYP domain-containing protein (c-di-GMP phosphodiesterase class II)
MALPELQAAALQRRAEKLNHLLEVAHALITERTLDPLLDQIVSAATRVAGAERCSLFLVSRDRRELWSKVAQGTGEVIRLPMGAGIAGQVAQTGRALNIPDAYADARFNREVDATTGFLTRSILCVPMCARGRQVVGVLQALNHIGGPFDEDSEAMLLALGAVAAGAIENASLYEEREQLFEGFVTASVGAIESRDPTTSGHSERVATLSVLCLGVLPRAHADFAALRVGPKEMRELRYAALLHDFGKVGVREPVLVKASKLYPEQLELVRARFREARLVAEADMLRARVALLEDEGPDRHARFAAIEAAWRARDAALVEMLGFVEAANRPTVLPSGGFERLAAVAAERYRASIDAEPRTLLTPSELESLRIPRGSLNDAERLEIESHVTHTIRFLSQIPWTHELARVPQIAGAHHEKLDGTGYPARSPSDAIPIEARVMTIADIYDALTASDRPYKAAVPHEKAIDILWDEAKRGKLDQRVLEAFVEARLPEQVAEMTRDTLEAVFDAARG